MLAIIDYGVGNLGSIENMLKKLGCAAEITSDTDAIMAASKIILPGVGSFDHGMRSLRAMNFENVLRYKALEQKVPVLGICLGMQMLGLSSEEGSEPGLGWIDGTCRRFGKEPWDERLKVPHMGWNNVFDQGGNPLLESFAETPRFYFVHSYHFECNEASLVAGTTLYGIQFTSMVRQGNIYGAQFHPEKSHRFGLALLRNFIERC